MSCEACSFGFPQSWGWGTPLPRPPVLLPEPGSARAVGFLMTHLIKEKSHCSHN